MKCQILFLGKNKKNISKCLLLKFLPSMLSINDITKTVCFFLTFLFSTDSFYFCYKFLSFLKARKWAGLVCYM